MVARRYESGGEAQALVRPARDRVYPSREGETSKGRERESECHCFLRKMLREGTAREGTARDTYSKYDKPDQVRMHLHGLLLSVPVMFEVCETRCK